MRNGVIGGYMKIKQIAALLFFMGLPMGLAQAMESFDNKHVQTDVKIKNLRSNKSSATADDVLLKHVRVMQELKEKSAVKNNTAIQVPATFEGLTQTEAHIKMHQKYVDQLYIDYPWLESSVKKMIVQEKTHNRTHYVFYHSHIARLNVVQDFMRELHQLLSVEILKDFQFLRNPHEAIWKESIEKILESQTPAFFDLDYSWQKRLLSVNLAFFGNELSDRWESAFTYFIANRSIKPPAQRELLLKLFSDLQIDTKYIALLEQIADASRINNSTLLQIFVPKDKVDSCVYLSHRYGRVYRDIVFPQCYDFSKRRHTRIAPILDYYKAHPEKICVLDKLQARIVFDRDIMLNPESGVKIMRYGLHLDQGKNNNYRTKIKEIALEVIKDHLRTGKTMVPVNPDMGKAPLQRLSEYKAQFRAKL